MTPGQLESFLKREFPQITDSLVLDERGPGHLRIRLQIETHHLRPGGIVSGPTMFMLADLSAYFVILLAIGPAKMAVTSGCSIDFLRPAATGELRAEAELLKLGRRLAVVEVLLHAAERPEPVARATLTYVLPQG